MNFDRLMSIFIIKERRLDEEPLPPANFLVALYTSRLLPKALELPVLSVKYGWSRSLAYTLNHLCAFAVFELTDKRQRMHATIV